MLRRVAEVILDDQLCLFHRWGESFYTLKLLFETAWSSPCMVHTQRINLHEPTCFLSPSQFPFDLFGVITTLNLFFSFAGQIGITHLLTSAGVPLWNSLSRRLQSLMRHMIEGVLVWSKYELNNELQRFARIQFWFIILKKKLFARRCAVGIKERVSVIRNMNTEKFPKHIFL
jgi:hypothetical protein